MITTARSRPPSDTDITKRMQGDGAPWLLSRVLPPTLESQQMTRPDVVMTEQRHREVEELARTMLSQSSSITPYHLADRAKINWFLARDVLRGLARKGHVRALASGRFSRPPE
jgi:hypothetical protein